MTVYVDEARHAFGRMVMCHMAALDVDELHAMAERIGVARKWFQDPKTMPVSRPHYDIAKSKRALAIAAGAQAIDRYQMVAISTIAALRHRGLPDDAVDPLRVLRPRDGRPGHPEFARVESWLAQELAAR